MVLINFPHKTSSRIPYIPSLNSKAALFMILSLSSAPGDLDLSLSASSWVTVNLYENRSVCQTVSQLFMQSVSLWVCFSIHLYCIVSSFILVIQSAWIHNDSRLYLYPFLVVWTFQDPLHINTRKMNIFLWNFTTFHNFLNLEKIKEHPFIYYDDIKPVLRSARLETFSWKMTVTLYSQNYFAWTQPIFGLTNIH